VWSCKPWQVLSRVKLQTVASSVSCEVVVRAESAALLTHAVTGTQNSVPSRLRPPKSKYKALEISEVGGPLKEKCLYITVTFGPFGSKACTHYNCCWGPFESQVAYWCSRICLIRYFFVGSVKIPIVCVHFCSSNPSLAVSLLMFKQLVQCRSQPRIFGGTKLFNCRRIALFFLRYRLSKYKMTTYAKNLGGHGALAMPMG